MQISEAELIEIERRARSLDSQFAAFRVPRCRDHNGKINLKVCSQMEAAFDNLMEDFEKLVSAVRAGTHFAER